MRGAGPRWRLSSAAVWWRRSRCARRPPTRTPHGGGFSGRRPESRDCASSASTPRTGRECGTQAWQRYKVRVTTEALAAAITGPLTAPRTVLLGRYDTGGRLHYTGRTTTLPATLSRALTDRLTPTAGAPGALRGRAGRSPPGGAPRASSTWSWSSPPSCWRSPWTSPGTRPAGAPSPTARPDPRRPGRRTGAALRRRGTVSGTARRLARPGGTDGTDHHSASGARPPYGPHGGPASGSSARAADQAVRCR
jgi:hypothetical protein